MMNKHVYHPPGVTTQNSVMLHEWTFHTLSTSWST